MYGVRIGWSERENRVELSASSGSSARSRTGRMVSVRIGGTGQASLGGLQPDPLAKRLPSGRQPTALRISHTTGIPRRSPSSALPTSHFNGQYRQITLPSGEFIPPIPAQEPVRVAR